MARDIEYILKLLEEYGMVSAEDIFYAREAAMNSDEITDPVEVLLKQGKIQESELLSMLAQQYGWDVVDLNDFEVDPEVIATISVDIAHHYTVFPVMKHDDIVDDYFNRVKAGIIGIIAENPTEGENALDLLMIAKYFERIGDHCTNIAEWVEFSATGTHKDCQ